MDVRSGLNSIPKFGNLNWTVLPSGILWWLSSNSASWSFFLEQFWTFSSENSVNNLVFHLASGWSCHIMDIMDSFSNSLQKFGTLESFSNPEHLKKMDLYQSVQNICVDLILWTCETFVWCIQKSVMDDPHLVTVLPTWQTHPEHKT